MSEPQPKSLHIIGGQGLGGVENFAIRLMCGLHARGAAVTAVVVGGGKIDAALPEYIPRYRLPMAGNWDGWSRWRIRRLIARLGPDVVQTYLSRAASLTSRPRTSRVPLLARPGGYYKVRHYLRYDSVVVTTEDIRHHFLEGGVASEDCVVIPNFVDVPPRVAQETLLAAKAELGLSGDDLVILGLGRLHPVKGWGDLLDAFAALPETLSGRKLYLLMVGDGPLAKELENKAQRLGVAGRVRWLGWRKDTRLYYQMADLFVCASHHEPFGNVILEAWANRVPIVSTRAEGPSVLIEDGANGSLVPIADPTRLADAIRRMLTQPRDALEKIADAGFQTVITHFSEDAIVSDYLALYKRLAMKALNNTSG